MNSQTSRWPPIQPDPPGSHAYKDGEPEYVPWIYLGAESVFFYPPGSVQEHLVVEHGVPSVDMHWKVKGGYSHEGDHHKQQGVRSGAVGDLVAVIHGHEQGLTLGHTWDMGHRTTAVTNGSPRTVESRR
jgi:hypothetical protein